MTTDPRIDHATLLRLLRYDPETGAWTRRIPRGTAQAGSEVGSVHPYGSRYYRHIRVGGKRYSAHRLAWFYMTGTWPRLDIDHIDGNGLNNRWANLREATRTENNANSKRRADNTTGFKGVNFHKRDKRFRAEICIGGKHVYLGYYATPEAAHAAYIAAAEKYFGEFARTK